MPADITVIKSIDDMLLALKRIDELWDADINFEEGKELDRLIDLVEAYEERNFPI